MDWLTTFTADLTLFDYLVILLLLVFLARGVWVGFIRQISVLIAMVAGFVVAGQLHGDFYGFLLPYLKNAQITFLITYIVLFAVIYGAVVLLGLGLRKVVTLSLLGWFDRTLGALFGLAKGFFLALLLFMALAVFISGSNSMLRRSFFFPAMLRGTAIALSLVRDHDLRSGFMPKEPAIPPPPPETEEAPESEQPPPQQKVPPESPRGGIFL